MAVSFAHKMEKNGGGHVATPAFMLVSHNVHNGGRDGTPIISKNGELEHLQHERGWQRDDIQTLMKGGMGDLYKAMKEIEGGLDKIETLKAAEVKQLLDLTFDLFREPKSETGTDVNALDSLNSALGDALDRMPFQSQDMGEDRKMNFGQNPFVSPAQFNAIKAATDSLKSFHEEMERHIRFIRSSPAMDKGNSKPLFSIAPPPPSLNAA